MMWTSLLILSLAVLLPATKAQDQTISLELPWGTYESDPLDKNDIYTFRNVRFGRDMSEEWRFKKSVAPSSVSDPSKIVQETGARCIQAVILENTNEKCIPGGSSSSFPNIQPPQEGILQSEDCLFLDLYVPKAAYDNKANHSTPVVVWIFGGAFIFGSKDYLLGGPSNAPFYSGSGPIVASGNNIIFVAGNYRVGAFGWLAGPVMEQDAFPNAGLSDQRLLLRWVQNYIHNVGGDNTTVSAWGESAGASSILHHLIARDPKTGVVRDPLFHRAALQSPAYEWEWDDVTLNTTYNNFLKALDCANCSISDLRKIPKDNSLLVDGNQQLIQEYLPCDGLFPLGPAIDHKIITELTPVALSGKPQQNFSVIDSIIVSHVATEAATFIPPTFNDTIPPTQATTEAFLKDFLPEPPLQSVIPQLMHQLPCSVNTPLAQNSCVETIIQDAVFVCNTRQLYNAYKPTSTKYYAFQYYYFNLFGAAVHASDLPPLFSTPEFDLEWFLEHVEDKSPSDASSYAKQFKSDNVPKNYQNYWTSHARFGDPNVQGGAPSWAEATISSSGYMQAMTIEQEYGGFGSTVWKMDDDELNTSDNCDFWTDLAFKAMGLTSPSPSAGRISGTKAEFPDEL